MIKEILAARVRTVEIRSPNNFFAISGCQPGERLFVTDSSALDVVPGTSGLITTIKALQIITHRTIQSGEYYYEESESQAARLQLQLVGIGRVRRISSIEPFAPLTLDVDEVRYCGAR